MAYLPTVGLIPSDWFAYQFPPNQEAEPEVRSHSLSSTASSGRRAQQAPRRARREGAGAGRRHRRPERVETGVVDVRGREDRDRARAVELAREDLRVQEERYQIGNATIVELQTSQVALADAEIAYLRARQALGVAIARLEATLGEQLMSDS